MSAPYGQPPAGSQPGPSQPGPSQPGMSQPGMSQPGMSQPGMSRSGRGGLGLGGILALVGAVLGLAAYFSTFTDDTLGLSQNLLIYLLLGGGLLAGASLLPKAPDALVPAAVLVVLGALGALALLVTLPELVETPSALIFVLVLGLLEAAALVAAVLVAGGVIKMTPKPAPFGSQQWGPQSGSFPAQPGQAQGQYPGQGQYGQAPPGPYGQQQQGQYPGQGQYGQPPQQPQPQSNPYGQPTAQWGQGPDFGDHPRSGEGGPGGPNPPYGQPGTPPRGVNGPGGVNGPDRS